MRPTNSENLYCLIWSSKSTDPKTVSLWLKAPIGAVLADKGIDNKVLAELIGVKPETVSRWVNNEIQPKPENLYKIAEVTKINLQELHILTHGLLDHRLLK